MLRDINNKQSKCVAEQQTGWGQELSWKWKDSFLKEWGKLKGTDLGQSCAKFPVAFLTPEQALGRKEM